MLKTTYRNCRSLLDAIGILAQCIHAPLLPELYNKDLANEHYSSFGRLKPYVTLQKPLGQGSPPRLTPTHNFDTTKKDFSRRSSRQAPLRPRMLVPFNRASFHRIMNLLHILAGCFYRLAQGVYTSRIFTQTTRRFVWVAGWLLTTFGRAGCIQQEYSLLPIAWLLWLEQTPCYDGEKRKIGLYIRPDRDFFISHGMAWHSLEPR